MKHPSNDLVTTIWGTIERREMLRLLGQAGIGLGLGLSGAKVLGRNGFDYQKPASDENSQNKDEEAPRPHGLPYREITPYQNSTHDIERMNPAIFAAPEHFARPISKDGTPPVHRRRSASWFDKPNGAYGRAIFQYTNTPAHQRDSCAQAAVA